MDSAAYICFSDLESDEEAEESVKCAKPKHDTVTSKRLNPPDKVADKSKTVIKMNPIFYDISVKDNNVLKNREQSIKFNDIILKVGTTVQNEDLNKLNSVKNNTEGLVIEDNLNKIKSSSPKKINVLKSNSLPQTVVKNGNSELLASDNNTSAKKVNILRKNCNLNKVRVIINKKGEIVPIKLRKDCFVGNIRFINTAKMNSEIIPIEFKKEFVPSTINKDGVLNGIVPSKNNRSEGILKAENILTVDIAKKITKDCEVGADKNDCVIKNYSVLKGDNAMNECFKEVRKANVAEDTDSIPEDFIDSSEFVVLKRPKISETEEVIDVEESILNKSYAQNIVNLDLCNLDQAKIISNDKYSAIKDDKKDCNLDNYNETVFNLNNHRETVINHCGLHIETNVEITPVEDDLELDNFIKNIESINCQESTEKCENNETETVAMKYNDNEHNNEINKYNTDNSIEESILEESGIEITNNDFEIGFSKICSQLKYNSIDEETNNSFNSSEIRCSHCDISFKNPMELKEHVNTVVLGCTSDTEMQWDYTETHEAKSSPTTPEMDEQSDESTEDCIPCPHCEEIFTDSCQLKLHIFHVIFGKEIPENTVLDITNVENIVSKSQRYKFPTVDGQIIKKRRRRRRQTTTTDGKIDRTDAKTDRGTDSAVMMDATFKVPNGTSRVLSRNGMKKTKRYRRMDANFASDLDFELSSFVEFLQNEDFDSRLSKKRTRLED